VFSADELATFTPEEPKCKCGDFINANLGYLLYDRNDGTSFIKRTNSGGDSWETIDISGSVTISNSIDPSQNGVYPVTHLDWFRFISSAAAYGVCSDVPVFLASANGGIDWWPFGVYPEDDAVPPNAYYPMHPTSISFFDLKNGVAFASGEIFRDVNDDITGIYPPHLWRYKSGAWSIQNETRLADMVEDDAFQFDTLVPMHNQIISTTTAIAFSFTGEQLLGFNSFFASPKLDDGYSEIGFSFDFYPSDVMFDTFQNGYAIGNGFQNGYILKTELAGNLWTPSLIQPAPFERVNAKLSVVDNDNVFAVSGDKIYRTFDSGENWEEIPIQIYN